MDGNVEYVHTKWNVDDFPNCPERSFNQHPSNKPSWSVVVGGTFTAHASIFPNLFVISIWAWQPKYEGISVAETGRDSITENAQSKKAVRKDKHQRATPEHRFWPRITLRITWHMADELAHWSSQEGVCVNRLLMYLYDLIVRSFRTSRNLLY